MTASEQEIAAARKLHDMASAIGFIFRQGGAVTLFPDIAQYSAKGDSLLLTQTVAAEMAAQYITICRGIPGMSATPLPLFGTDRAVAEVNGEAAIAISCTKEAAEALLIKTRGIMGV